MESKFGGLESKNFKPKLECGLNVLLSSKGMVLSAKFDRVKCDFDW